MHPKIVQERLGHSTISITLDIYSHVNPAMDPEAASTVAALICESSWLVRMSPPANRRV